MFLPLLSGFYSGIENEKKWNTDDADGADFR